MMHSERLAWPTRDITKLWSDLLLLLLLLFVDVVDMRVMVTVVDN